MDEEKWMDGEGVMKGTRATPATLPFPLTDVLFFLQVIVVGGAVREVGERAVVANKTEEKKGEMRARLWCERVLGVGESCSSHDSHRLHAGADGLILGQGAGHGCTHVGGWREVRARVVARGKGM